MQSTLFVQVAHEFAIAGTKVTCLMLNCFVHGAHEKETMWVNKNVLQVKFEEAFSQFMHEPDKTILLLVTESQPKQFDKCILLIPLSVDSSTI